jgi:hypothetical protein
VEGPGSTNRIPLPGGQKCPEISGAASTLDLVDGSNPVTVPVEPTIKAALEAYRAGTAGPDAYPDILFGQS